MRTTGALTSYRRISAALEAEYTWRSAIGAIEGERAASFCVLCDGIMIRRWSAESGIRGVSRVNVIVVKKILQCSGAVVLILTAGLIGCGAREARAQGRPTVWTSLGASYRGRRDPHAGAVGRATHLEKTGRCVEAKDVLKRAFRENPSNVRTYVALARLYVVAGRGRRALEYANAAQRRDPKDVKVWRLLALANLSAAKHAGFFGKIGAVRDVKASLERVVALDPHDGLSLYYLEQLNASLPWLLGGSERRAQRELAILRRINPGLALMAVAAKAETGHEWKLAVKDFNEALQRYPSKGVQIVSFQDAVFLMHQRDPAGARSILQGLMARFPRFDLAGYALAVMDLRTRRDLREAVAYLKHYLSAWRVRCGPRAGLARAHYRLGRLYGLLGRTADERKQYAAAVTLDKHFKRARQARVSG